MTEIISNKKKSPANVHKEMSFWEHLEELRWHLIRSVIVLIVFTVLAFIYSDFLFDSIIFAPKSPDFITARVLCKIATKYSLDYLCINQGNLNLINIDMSGQLTTQIYVALVSGFVIALPYILWEIWRFIKPALKAKELKHSKVAISFIFLLFVSGILVSYFLFVPLTINFLGTYQISKSVVNQITLTSYISTVSSLTLATGIVFELPVIVFFLSKIGIISPKFLKKNRRTAIVIILTIAAIITPGTDVFSQIMVSIPLFFLYELSIIVSKRVYKPSDEI